MGAILYNITKTVSNSSVSFSSELNSNNQAIFTNYKIAIGALLSNTNYSGSFSREALGAKKYSLVYNFGNGDKQTNSAAIISNITIIHRNVANTDAVLSNTNF
jgi:hypothetical protein